MPDKEHETNCPFTDCQQAAWWSLRDMIRYLAQMHSAETIRAEVELYLSEGE